MLSTLTERGQLGIVWHRIPSPELNMSQSWAIDSIMGVKIKGTAHAGRVDKASSGIKKLPFSEGFIRSVHGRPLSIEILHEERMLD
jgi:hypothetical protein